jgi:hypothetical protein
MPKLAQTPTQNELKGTLGAAYPLWSRLVADVEAKARPLEQIWKTSKAEFGRVCLLQHHKRTLLYITPDKKKVTVAIVLGERAYGLAMESALPDGMKKMLSEARPYAEGRGIRFSVSSTSELSVVAELVDIKLKPK